MVGDDIRFIEFVWMKSNFTSHAPSLGLALCGRWTITEQGSWKEVQPPDSWKEMVPAPCKKYQQRIDTFRGATLSVTARCTAYNTFIISVMPYTASYFGLSTTDLNTLRQSAVKYILRRHWLEAEIMPYVFRLAGIAPLMDPALAATVAALGLYLREGNTFFLARCCLGQVPGGAPFSQRSEQATACTNRMQIRN